MKLQELLLGFLVCAIIVVLCVAAWRNLKKGKGKKPNTGTTTLSPTLQWLNTAGAILLAVNKGDFHYMGGMYIPGNEQDNRKLESIKTMLRNYWEIDGHESAMETMAHLVSSGMRSRYWRDMVLLETVFSQYSEQELIEEARKHNPNANAESLLLKTLMAYRKYGENALLGWDVGRAAYIIQCCYFVGYVSMEEVLEIGVEAGKLAQECFKNWDELMGSYLLGGQYWQEEDANEPNSMTAGRRKLCEKLRNGTGKYKVNPYQMVAFQTPLSKEVMTDQYGMMPASQAYA